MFFSKKPVLGQAEEATPPRQPNVPTQAKAEPQKAVKAEAPPASAPAAVAAPAALPAPLPSRATEGSCLLVGPEVKLKGAEITDCDTLIVEGRVEATMDSRVIQIAESGAFSGKVCIDVAEIRGRFEGELTARKQLVIYATGRVSGKIRYGKVVIEEGGELSGDVRALSAEQAAAPALSDPIPLMSRPAAAGAKA